LLSNLKLLLSARAWLKSRTLNVAGILGAIAAWDIAAGGNVIQTAVQFLVNSLGVMESTALAILVGVKAIADALLRVKTDKSVAAK